VALTLDGRPATEVRKLDPPRPTCDLCGRPMQPGEQHAQIGPDALGNPQVICKVIREQPTEVV